MRYLHGRGSSDKIVWTEIDQKQAIFVGIFIARETDRSGARPFHHARIVNRVDPAQDISHIIALRAFRCEPLFEKMEAFIRQQNQHGWSGAWENRCDCEFAMLQRMRAKRQRAIASRLRGKPLGALPVRRPPKTVVF